MSAMPMHGFFLHVEKKKGIVLLILREAKSLLELKIRRMKLLGLERRIPLD